MSKPRKIDRVAIRSNPRHRARPRRRPEQGLRRERGSTADREEEDRWGCGRVPPVRSPFWSAIARRRNGRSRAIRATLAVSPLSRNLMRASPSRTREGLALRRL